MDLDKQIIKGKTYLDCFDIEMAKKFIGKECYIAEKISDFANLNNLTKAKLINVADYGNDTQPYILSDEHSNYVASIILPCEWVKEQEPKYRPYKSAQEFFNDIGCSVGDVISYKRKSDDTRYRSTIVGTSYKDGYELVFFCNEWYTMKELFDLCEVFTSGDWRPFGIKE